MFRLVSNVLLVLSVLMVLAGCGGGAPAPVPTVTTAPKVAPTTVPPTTAPAAAPKATDAPKAAPTTAPAAAPKATDAPKAAATTAPTAAAKTGATSADVSFGWAPGSVPPADADDTAIIIEKLKPNAGFIGATGDENGMTVTYNPSLITVEKIMELFNNMGHPVVKK